MAWIFGLLGAFGGSWIASESKTLFGFVIGFLFGWLLHRVLDGQATIRQLSRRIDALEQQSAKHDRVETVVEKKVVEKKIDTPERVSIYEPQPIEEVASAIHHNPLSRRRLQQRASIFESELL